MKFTIVIYKRDDYLHTEVFTELIKLLTFSLIDLGHKVAVSTNIPKINSINILVGFISTEYLENFKGFKTIYFQLESLKSLKQSDSTNNLFPMIQQWIETCDYIWDYNEKNLFEYSHHNPVEIVEIGYHHELELIPDIPVIDREIDILFIGSRTIKRNAILQKFKESELKFVSLFNCYGQERDEYIANSKIVLNIHINDESDLLESTRISYLMNNKVFCLTENSSNVYSNIRLIEVRAEELLVKAREFILKPQQIEHIRKKQYNLFKTDYTFSNILQELLNKIAY